MRSGKTCIEALATEDAASEVQTLEKDREGMHGGPKQVHAGLEEWQRAPSELLQILRNLGFPESEASDSCLAASAPKQLSGKWRMEVELAKAPWLRPKLFLLHEPTNHLDFRAAREWLIEQIAEYPHTAVVVSHDMAFLHKVCKDIIWMAAQRLETLPGKICLSQEDLLRMQRRKPLRLEFRVPSGEDPVSRGKSLHDDEFTYGSLAAVCLLIS
ncbi:ABCF3 [Symbiodinium sp. CCMP2592]|nr:ABCF3 [Symbiodinium sp. CCMP2592]